MKRIVSFLLLTLVILSGIAVAQSPAKNGPVEGLPRIVARMKLTKQSGIVPPTVIFTPKTNGLFRLSMAIVVTTAADSDQGSLFGVIEYSNVIKDSVEGAVVNAGHLGSYGVGETATFAAKGGQPFKFSTFNTGNITGAVYDVYFVIERLTKIPNF